ASGERIAAPQNPHCNTPLAKYPPSKLNIKHLDTQTTQRRVVRTRMATLREGLGLLAVAEHGKLEDAQEARIGAGQRRRQTLPSTLAGLLGAAVVLGCLAGPVGAQEEPLFRGVQTRQTIIDAWQGENAGKIRFRGGAARHTADTGVPLSFLIAFAKDDASLTDTARRQVDEIAKAIKSAAFAGSHYRIEGHTNVTGTAEYNLGLSERRAQTVLSYLIVVHGIDQRALSAVGMGEQDLYNPTDPTASENRRVRIIRFAS
ncbi:MAG TPA: OmpA family protein, partial [Rhodocyclaceae bacterium]|nr:OmpA family protein [Rhodocyclaceae bacterium]